MTERGVSDIVSQCRRFDKVFVQIESSSDRPSNLCNLKDVSHPRREVVSLWIDQDLTLVL